LFNTKREGAYIDNISVISQFPDFLTGCEAVSAVMALRYLGEDITVDNFVDFYLDKSDEFCYENGNLIGPNPIEVFVGNPRSQYSFGCMSPVIEKALIKYFDDSSRIKRYKNASLDSLCAKYIDNGVPVIVWATIAMIPSFESASWLVENDEEFV
jgi:uncharacterized protein YvpB